MTGRPLWTLFVIACACVGAATVIADLIVHPASSLILRTIRQWSDIRYARKWGIPTEALQEETQACVAARLRADAVRDFGMTEPQWQEFVDAHPVTTGGSL